MYVPSQPLPRQRLSIAARGCAVLFSILFSYFGYSAAQAFPRNTFNNPTQVLDIERLRIVSVRSGFTESPTCQVLVIGGGLGGVAAAEVLAKHGVSVILTEATSHLGGQLTVEGDSVPDENEYIEDEDGPGTRNYRELRKAIRDYYAGLKGILPGRADNVGACWNSVVSAEPDVWESAIKSNLAILEGPRQIRRILLREQPVDVHVYLGNGKISYVDFVNLDSGKLIRIGARFVLDATETGDVLALAGSPWTIGQEAKSTYNEPDAPVQPHPEWVQSFTYCFLLRRSTISDIPPAVRPDMYGSFQALGQYSLLYEYSTTRGPIQYKMFERAPGSSGPFWTYRRLVAESSFVDNPDYSEDISLINWSGNDFRQEQFIGQPIDKELQALVDGRNFAAGFRYWLETECPRDDGGDGYPKLQPASELLGTDGIADYPYIRESRRLLAVTTLNENDLIPARETPSQEIGTQFFDTVGIASYPIDLHPALGEQPKLIGTLPYELPLGSFIPRSGPTNIVPAAMNFGASRLAMASARVHPIEWLSGEVAGHIAEFCLKREIDPAVIRNTPFILKEFQRELEKDGINTNWQIELEDSR